MTMTPDAFQFSMSMLLQQETDLTRQLSGLLDNEYAAVTAKDFTSFEQAVRDKAVTVEQLELLGQERLALIESAGFQARTEEVSAFLRWCDPGRNIAPDWENLLDIAAGCSDKNRRNHHLIELCSRHTRETLRILRGEDAHADLYRPDGDTDEDYDSRSLARA